MLKPSSLKRILAGLSLALAISSNVEAQENEEPKNTLAIEQSGGSSYYYPGTTKLEFSNSDLKFVALPRNDYESDTTELFFDYTRPLGETRLGFVASYLDSESSSKGFGIGPKFSWEGDSTSLSGYYLIYDEEQRGNIILRTKHADFGLGRNSNAEELAYFVSTKPGNTYLTLGQKASGNLVGVFILEPQENGKVGIFNITEFGPDAGNDEKRLYIYTLFDIGNPSRELFGENLNSLACFLSFMPLTVAEFFRLPSFLSDFTASKTPAELRYRQNGDGSYNLVLSAGYKFVGSLGQLGLGGGIDVYDSSDQTKIRPAFELAYVKPINDSMALTIEGRYRDASSRPGIEPETTGYIGLKTKF